MQLTPNTHIRFTRSWFGITTGTTGTVTEATEYDVTVDVGEEPEWPQLHTMTRAEAVRYLEVVA